MDPSSTTPSPDGSKLTRCLRELEATCFLGSRDTPDSFASMIAYYQKETRWKRRWFRAASMALMALGASLPVVAAFAHQLRGGSLAVSVMSAGIAFLTGVLSHFRWEVGWRAQTEALFALRAEKTAWESAVALAKLQRNDEEAVQLISQAFDQLRTRVFEITRDERGKFFKAAQPPQVKSLSSS